MLEIISILALSLVGTLHEVLRWPRSLLNVMMRINHPLAKCTIRCRASPPIFATFTYQKTAFEEANYRTVNGVHIIVHILYRLSNYPRVKPHNVMGFKAKFKTQRPYRPPELMSKDSKKDPCQEFYFCFDNCLRNEILLAIIVHWPALISSS